MNRFGYYQYNPKLRLQQTEQKPIVVRSQTYVSQRYIPDSHKEWDVKFKKWVKNCMRDEFHPGRHPQYNHPFNLDWEVYYMKKCGNAPHKVAK